MDISEKPKKFSWKLIIFTFVFAIASGLIVWMLFGDSTGPLPNIMGVIAITIGVLGIYGIGLILFYIISRYLKFRKKHLINMRHK